MDAIRPFEFMQRWLLTQHELLAQLVSEVGALTPKLEKVVHVLEWARIEELVAASGTGVGRPPFERYCLANAFVAKAVLGLKTTNGLIERLQVDPKLRRICGFALNRKLPSEATFSRAFKEFAESKLAERAHEALIKEQLGDQLIGHLSRDGTAIVARERPNRSEAEMKTAPPVVTPQASLVPDERVAAVPSADTASAKPGSPRGEQGPQPSTAKVSPTERQRKQTLPQMLAEIPTACDRGSKSNAQGYKIGWNGYKLHIDTADCGVPIAAVLTSASVHDIRVAIPLSLISQDRVTNLYDVMDAAYCSGQLHEHCRDLGHVPLIDHNPRNGEKEAFEPADALRYNERTAAERTNARLKSEFGADSIWVRGATKVMSHLMFGVLVLAADQLMRLRL